MVDLWQFRVTPCRKSLLVDFVLLANFADCRFQGRWKDWWIIGAKLFSLGNCRWGCRCDFKVFQTLNQFLHRGGCHFAENSLRNQKSKNLKNRALQFTGSKYKEGRRRERESSIPERQREIKQLRGGSNPPLLPLAITRTAVSFWFFSSFFSFILLFPHARPNNSNFQ